MEKRNTLLLTVIAVATLLVAVVGATFAYFGVNTNTANIINVTAKTGGAGATVIVEPGWENGISVNVASTGDDDPGYTAKRADNTELNVTYAGASAAKAVNNATVAAVSDTEQLAVVVNPNDKTTATQCVYTVQLSEVSGSSHYLPTRTGEVTEDDATTATNYGTMMTDGSYKEFTIKMTIAQVNSIDEFYDKATTVGGTSTPATEQTVLLKETQINKIITAAAGSTGSSNDFLGTGTGAINFEQSTYVLGTTKDATGYGQLNIDTTDYTGKILMTIPANTDSQVQIITATVSIYNTPWDQSKALPADSTTAVLTDRTFKYTISIPTDSVYCANEA